MSDYERMEKAIRYLEAHFLEQPGLSDLARAAGLSEFHFQRLFTRWAGVSPKRFAQYLTASYAKQRLIESRSVLDATLDSGLSSPGRIHDLLVAVEAMSPGEYKAQGRGLTIEHGVHPSPFGDCLIAVTARGVCGMTFLSGTNAKTALTELRERWPGASLLSSQASTAVAAEKIFGPSKKPGAGLRVLLKGSPFQLKVWEALLRVPPGKLVAYQDLALAIGAPKASRAVGNAVGGNPIAYLIPCHRVIRESGIIGNYRWGTQRKKAIIAWEAARFGRS